MNNDDNIEQHPNKRSSLVSRLAASTAILAALIVLMAVVFFQTLTGHLFQKSFDTPLKEWTNYAARHISQDKDIAKAMAKNHHVAIVYLSKEQSYAFDFEGNAVDPEALLNLHDRYRQIDVTVRKDQQFSFFLDEANFAAEQTPLLVWLVILMLIIIGSIYALQASQLRPLKWLETGVEAVSRGDFSVRVPVIRKDEIGSVAHSFNVMATPW